MTVVDLPVGDRVGRGPDAVRVVEVERGVRFGAVVVAFVVDEVRVVVVLLQGKRL